MGDYSEEDFAVDGEGAPGGKGAVEVALDHREDGFDLPSLAVGLFGEALAQFPAVVSFLERSEYQAIVSKVNYYENKDVIMRLTAAISAIRKGGAALSIILGVIAGLVAFNTIRITIYTLKDEIGIMKLVGATNWFVRGPFLIAGALYGVVASLVTMFVFYPLVFALSPAMSRFFPGADLLVYFQHNFLALWLILLSVGVVLSVAGSVIAIGKYLKI